MDFFNGILSLLALVVLLLTAMVAWLYVQQSRLMQAVSALTAAITAPPPVFFEAVKEFPIPEEEEEAAPETAAAEQTAPVADDRVSVREEEEAIEEEDEAHESDSQPDDLGGKTIAQLRELLNGKGIPFNKSDKKPTLVNLLKAAS
jgi:hypothetical protein